MKFKFFLFVFASFILFAFRGINSESNCILLFEKANNIKFYQYGKSAYYEFFLDEKKKFKGNEYYVQLRRYSWGDTDTTYVRKAETNYMKYDKSEQNESMLLPIEPMLGDNWKDKDGNWEYKVIEKDLTFKTPIRNYRNCIKLKCQQLTNSSPKKDQTYYLYYSREFGYVGNVDENNKILSYLKIITLNAKAGESIKNK